MDLTLGWTCREALRTGIRSCQMCLTYLRATSAGKCEKRRAKMPVLLGSDEVVG